MVIRDYNVAQKQKSKSKGKVKIFFYFFKVNGFDATGSCAIAGVKKEENCYYYNAKVRSSIWSLRNLKLLNFGFEGEESSSSKLIDFLNLLSSDLTSFSKILFKKSDLDSLYIMFLPNVGRRFC